MADKHYYVSQQNGNDTNDGLSAATAWATLTKALAVTGSGIGNVYIHVGPGVYREKLSVTNGGSYSYWLIWAGDPECRFLTNDKPGRVRITGCDATEQPTTGSVIYIPSVSYIEFRDFDVDGSSSGACVQHGSDQAGNGWGAIWRRLRVTGYGGFWGGRAINCVAICSATCYQYGTQIRCIGVSAGGSGDTFQSGRRLHCIAVGGYRGFGGEGTYDERTYNCLAIGCQYGFTISSKPASNCLAFACQTGFQALAFDCIAALCTTGFTGARFNCKAVLTTTPSSGGSGDPVGTAQMAVLDILNLADAVLGPSLRNGGWWCCFHYNNTVTGATLDLTTERLIDITNPINGLAGYSKGVAIYIEAKAAAGNVTVELQKYVAGAWTTQKYRTMAVADLVNLKFNRFEWNAGTGDDLIPNNLAAGTWRYRITADVDAQSTTIRTSDGAAVSYQGFMLPQLATEDFDGRPFPGGNGYPDIGPWELTDYTLDWATYQTNAPAIKINLKGQVVYQVPVKGGEAITVKWQVRHHGTADGLKPQIILRGLGITEQVATHSGAADTWQELSVSATPAVSGVLECVLYARDTASGAYSHFSDPVVS